MATVSCALAVFYGGDDPSMGSVGSRIRIKWNCERVDTVDGSEIPRPTTWDVSKPVNNGLFTISTGAGLLPSTVVITGSHIF